VGRDGLRVVDALDGAVLALPALFFSLSVEHGGYGDEGAC
jgi:hypothetical protein